MRQSSSYSNPARTCSLRQRTADANLQRWKTAKSGHHWSMSNDFKLIVYFSCPHCATIYTASQQEQPGRHPGYFLCRMCATPVHEWSGLYNFTDWKPVTTTPRRKRSPAPRSRVCVLIPTLRLKSVCLSTFEQKSNPFHFNCSYWDQSNVWSVGRPINGSFDYCRCSARQICRAV